MNEGSLRKVVILGAGVAGLRIAKKLQRSLKNPGWEVILIDENDYHQYLYRIHEVCNVEYRAKDIIVPINRLIDMDKITFTKTHVKSVDPKRRVVETTTGDQPYDILAVTLGSHPAYFGIDGIQEHSLTLGSYEEAKKIRVRILELVEEAEERGEPPVIVIGGGGFSGVELAGELTDWLPILYEEHSIPQPEKLIIVVEALSTILPGWDEKMIQRGQEVLWRRGIEFVFNDPVVRVGERRLEMKSGLVLEPDLFVWTGGVIVDPACGMDFEIRGRRIMVDEHCRAVHQEDVYVAGDTACAVDSEDRPQPPTAHIAMVQGDIVAHNILAQIKGDAKKKYVFNRAGEIVTLGRTNAVGDLLGFRFTGAVAKLLKRLVHWWYVHSIGGFSLLLGG